MNREYTVETKMEGRYDVVLTTTYCNGNVQRRVLASFPALETAAIFVAYRTGGR